MPPVLVLSVPHTGTMFTLSLFPVRLGSWPGPFEQNRKYFCHLRDPFADIAKQECYTVIPLRDYDAVKRSWQRDRMDLEDLSKQWKDLHKIKNAFFLPIDTADRSERLAILSDELGVKLATDWTPQHSFTV